MGLVKFTFDLESVLKLHDEKSKLIDGIRKDNFLITELEKQISVEEASQSKYESQVGRLKILVNSSEDNIKKLETRLSAQPDTIRAMEDKLVELKKRRDEQEDSVTGRQMQVAREEDHSWLVDRMKYIEDQQELFDEKCRVEELALLQQKLADSKEAILNVTEQLVAVKKRYEENTSFLHLEWDVSHMVMDSKPEPKKTENILPKAQEELLQKTKAELGKATQELLSQERTIQKQQKENKELETILKNMSSQLTFQILDPNRALAKTGRAIRARKHEWFKQHNLQRRGMIEPGDKASHYGDVESDILLYLDTKGNLRENVDIQAFVQMYKVKPQIAMYQAKINPSLVQAMNWAADIENFERHRVRSPLTGPFFLLYDQLVGKMDPKKPLLEAVQFLNSQHEGGTVKSKMEVSYNACSEASKKYLEQRRAEQRY